MSFAAWPGPVPGSAGLLRVTWDEGGAVDPDGFFNVTHPTQENQAST